MVSRFPSAHQIFLVSPGATATPSSTRCPRPSWRIRALTAAPLAAAAATEPVAFRLQSQSAPPVP